MDIEQSLIEFYSLIGSDDLIISLSEDDLLGAITTLLLTVGLFSALFFYKNPFDFRKSFNKLSHWWIVMGVAAFISFLFVFTTCVQNGYEEGSDTFLAFAIACAVLTAFLFAIFSRVAQPFGNSVTKFTPKFPF
jgi:hypothetical protein